MATKLRKARRSVRVFPSTGTRSVSKKQSRGVIRKPGKSQIEPAMRIWLPGEPMRFAEPKSHGNFCATDRAEKPCFIRPLFVGAELSIKFGVQPGAYLANCSGQSKKPGKMPADLVPVKSRRDALAKGEKFCACRREGKAGSTCAKRLGGRPAKIKRRGGKPKRRRR